MSELTRGLLPKYSSEILDILVDEFWYILIWKVWINENGIMLILDFFVNKRIGIQFVAKILFVLNLARTTITILIWKVR